MYYNIDSLHGEAELGITIGEQSCWGQGYGREAVALLLELLLGRQGFRRLYLKTLDWNERARRCFARCGLAEYGRAARGGNTFVLMEYRQEWLPEPEHTEGPA
jgi:RimJ/RimL family protein N-acetyltransferase